MAKSIYSPAALDLGIGDGDLLANEVDTDEEEKKKKLLRAGQALTKGNSMGLAAQNLLGQFRG
jgi:hypothetical protein